MSEGASSAKSPAFGATPRTTLRRHPERASYDRALIYEAIDEALICHVGFVADGHPVVIPTIHARIGDTLYIHGSAAGRMLGTLAAGTDVCVTVTLVDGLVVARAAFSHSVNYRSVMIFGRTREVLDRDERLRALEATVEHVVPGRSADARRPDDDELEATRLIALRIDEVSAKVRTGPPKDKKDDCARPIWAGIVPLVLSALPPIADDQLPTHIAPPEYVTRYRRP